MNEVWYLGGRPGERVMGQVPGRWERVCNSYPCSQDCVRLIAFQVLSTSNLNSSIHRLFSVSSEINDFV